MHDQSATSAAGPYFSVQPARSSLENLDVTWQVVAQWNVPRCMHIKDTHSRVRLQYRPSNTCPNDKAVRAWISRYCTGIQEYSGCKSYTVKAPNNAPSEIMPTLCVYAPGTACLTVHIFEFDDHYFLYCLASWCLLTFPPGALLQVLQYHVQKTTGYYYSREVSNQY